jgi:isoquinoline 1-oxidoreductase beta subunit
MSAHPALSRRDFLKVTYTTGAGLMIAFALPGCSKEASNGPAPTPTSTLLPALKGPDALTPNVFVTIGHDGLVSVTVPRSEMGQGVRTAFAMILAEELDADWKSIRVKQADADPVFGDQHTGGSASISGSYMTLRLAGATARSLLISAAAKVWGVARAICTAENGMVIRSDTGAKLSFGYLVPLAATLPLPNPIGTSLKDPKKFHIVGTRMASVDTTDIVTGHARFGMDIRLPGMLHAVVAHNPTIDGTISHFDAAKAMQVPGVRKIVPLDTGVAVVGDTTWSAMQGRQALTVTYEDGPTADYSSHREEQLMLQTAFVKPGARELVQYYVVPFLSHAPMEPMNCVADVRADRCDVWVSSQDPPTFKDSAEEAAGTSITNLHVPLIGGGFGRRLQIGPVDYVAEAVHVSKAVGAPIKLFWTREEDIQHEYYHPLSVTMVRADLGDISTLQLNRSESSAVPAGAWRSVENVPEAFAHECFVDEFAHATKQDPVQLRREFVESRGLTVINLAAEKAGWGTPLPAGHGRGIAYHATWDVTHVAQVAEVSVDHGGNVRVHRVVCAVDCGVVVNPDSVEAQMESGIIFGMTAALKSSLSFEKGRVQQSNFHDYPLLRMDEAPVIEVYIVPSQEDPSGVGEMSNPVIMPAVANAVFAATGVRVRRVPILPKTILAG